MPVPLIPAVILAASALTGTVGTYTTVDSGIRIKKAKGRYDCRRDRHNREEQRYKNLRKKTQSKFRSLGKCRLKGLKTMGEAGDFLKKAKIKERDLCQKFDITPNHLREWEGASTNAIEVLSGVIGSTGAGASTASAAYGLVGLFGKASTGTAIKSLSGAAAKNATLAWLGGGSLATSGGGMALGATVLNGIIIGPGLLVAGFFAGRKAEEIETEVTRHIGQMDVAEAEMKQQMKYLRVVNRRVDELRKATIEVDTALQQLLLEGCPSNLEDAYKVARTAKTLGELLDVDVTDENGTLIIN